MRKKSKTKKCIKDEIRKINLEQWHSLKEATYVTIIDTLNSVSILLDYTNNPTDITKSPSYVTTALYTHAVEEFGKLTYLMQLKPENGYITIEYDKKFKNHKYKFKLALDNLHRECIVVQRGDEEIVTDWETRLRILNTDIDKKGNFKRPPLINLGDLSRAVLNFKNMLAHMNIKN